MTVVKIGSAVVEHQAQNKAHNANESSALDALRIKNNELSVREVQERIAGGQQEEEIGRQVTDASSDVKTSAATRGVTGMTVDTLLNDILGQGAAVRVSTREGVDANIDQLEREKRAARSEATSRINSVPGANLAGTGLKVAGALVDYAAVKIGQKPRGT